MQFLQNRPASTTANTKLAHPEKTHTHTHSLYLHPRSKNSTPPCDSAAAWNSAELLWRAADGTGSPLLSFIEHYLFYSFCSTDAQLHVASLPFLRWNDPIPHPLPFLWEKSGAENVAVIFLFVCFLPFKSQFPAQHLFPLLPLSLSAGILKFHEVYLGEGVSEGGMEFQESSGGVISGSSLEQHIASAREALGVESYYSRWDVHSCHCEIRIVCLLAHYLYHNLLIWE